MPRILLAGLFHETHTFLSGTTDLADFERREGDALLAAEGDGSPLAAVLEVAREKGWQLVPIIDLRATPGPTATDEVVDTFWSAFEAVAKREAGRYDGIALVLHGAMVSESCLDVEGEVLERIRKLAGPDIPICGVLDLHGNVTAKLAANSNGLVAYRQNPHADAHAASRDGALLLDRCLRTGERPVTVWSRPPVMWPPTGTGTAFDPMQTLESMARQLEKTHPELLAVNVFAGFSFADTPDTGVSFTACTVGDPAAAEQALQTLSEWAVAHRHLGNPQEPSLDTVLDQIHAGHFPAGSRPQGPVVLAEPSDNIGGGAPGDGTAVLQAFVARKIQNAALAINDPHAVSQLLTLQPGQRMMLEIGGRGSPLSGGPMPLEVELVSTSDGRFDLEDPNSHLASMCGSHFDMGPSAIVRHGGITILLTSHKTPPFDLGQWRSQGIIPETLSYVAVKAAVAHRRVYDPIARCNITIDTPGPCSSNVARFPFRHVQRPVYPLDE